VFVSIGYSTCHWCHVMESESFEDEDVAALMNKTFVSIKVDREERPDIDNLYMSLCQLMRQQCGWPLNLILTPDKKPFFAATYIPKESRYQAAGMLELIPRIADLWRDRRGDAENSAADITRILAQSGTVKKGDTLLPPEIIESATKALTSRYDSEYAGFGRAPKFPSPHILLFLMQRWRRTKDKAVLQMVTETLSAMMNGGIYDHLGYGFHRYSTDRKWQLPHFEKMLYDQAMMLLAYSEAFHATGSQKYHDISREIGEYVVRELSRAGGGFYSAEDADSEGIEGKFYVWSTRELNKSLTESEVDYLRSFYGVRESGNFDEEAPTGNLEGANILSRQEKALPGRDDTWNRIRTKLFEVRDDRVHPAKDDKILTDWNGLMIAAFARSSSLPGLDSHLDVARDTAAFILSELTINGGRLLHRWRNGIAGIAGTAPDYAYMIFGLIELYQQSFEDKWLSEALRLNAQFIKHFNDSDDGGFFFTAEDGEKLLVRQKDLYDGALPSSNSMALNNLVRLSRITGDVLLENMADGLLRYATDRVMEAPSAHTGFLLGYDHLTGSSVEVVIVGERGAEGTEEMIHVLRSNLAPHVVGVFKPSNEKNPTIEKLAPYITPMTAIEERATAYVCRNHSCRLPTTKPEEMLSQIRELS